MNRRLTPLFPLVWSLMLSSGVAIGTAPLSAGQPETQLPPPSRDTFYCQLPDYAMLYNVSSGFDAEMADDIPIAFAGELVGEVILWLGEWYSMGGPSWQDPVGVQVSFYHESCPPELDPFRTVEIPWGELNKTLVHDTGGSTIYEIRVALVPALVVEEGMSLGATVLIDWGQSEPFAGLCLTPFFVTYGACVAYFDGENWGYQRWTAIDYYSGIPQDLAYCLARDPAAAPEIVGDYTAIDARPNPCHSSATIHYTLARPGHVSLRVHDITGRRVATLLDAWRAAGELRIRWAGCDDAGRPLPAGVYAITLRAPDGLQRSRLTLLD